MQRKQLLLLIISILAIIIIPPLATVAHTSAATTISIQNPLLLAAFIRSGNLWIKQGEREQQLTKSGQISNPTWSFDGRWLAYLKSKEVWVYDRTTQTHYPVNSEGGYLAWSPTQNILAILDERLLNAVEIRADKPLPFVNVSLGVDNYSWLPDGSGFLVTADANLLPDGWTRSILFKVAFDPQHPPDIFAPTAQRFFIVPSPLRKGEVQITPIDTSIFKWSATGKWIAFIVGTTASLSMDSNLLCTLNADGKQFAVWDEMLKDANWFQWSPHLSSLAYIQGGGRIVFGFKNKNLKVQDLPAFQSIVLTPKHFVDLGFTWQDDETIITSRAPEQEWSNNPSLRPRPALYRVGVQQGTQQKITNPPAPFGDDNPLYLPANAHLTWVRSSPQQNEIWIARADGSGARRWIQQIDNPSAISWYYAK